MCNINWEILHKFVDSLIWPLIVIFLLFAFRKKIVLLANRISKHSTSVEIGNLKIILKEMNELKEKLLTNDEQTLKEIQELTTGTVKWQIAALRQFGEEYITSIAQHKILIEDNIKEFCVGLTINDLKELFNSNLLSDKVALSIFLVQEYDRHKIKSNDYSVINKFIVDNEKANDESLKINISSLRKKMKKDN